MAVRKTAGERQRKPGLEAAGRLEPIVTLLARALDLERVALLVEASSGTGFVPAAVHGTADVISTDPGSWEIAIPVRCGARQVGLLLLDPRPGRSLPAADRALAERIASAVADVIGAERLAADLARTRELLARADRLSALGTLSAGVAHEIRNPLVSVRTFIQLLPERLGDEEFRTGFRDLALGEIERICALINDLLAFSRPAPAEREATDLNELVAQITRLLDAEARRRDVTVLCQGDPALPLVVVNDAQVKQVLMNLILNAIQACGPRGTVEIATRIEESGGERWCTVAVMDSGAGIAPEHLEQIFDPFFTTKDAGSGLGLFIARQIVSAHGGQIQAAPRPEGGTEFSVHFPLEARAADADLR